MSSPEHIKELDSAPDTVLSLQAATKQVSADAGKPMRPALHLNFPESRLFYRSLLLNWSTFLTLVVHTDATAKVYDARLQLVR